MNVARDRFAAAPRRRPLLADGAMGTLLFSRGVPQRAWLDELATTRPDLVGAIHREYIDAGADSSRPRPSARTGSASRRSASRGRPRASTAAPPSSPARRATWPGRDVLVAGSIGPLGAPDPRARATPDEAAIRAAFREQIEGLLEGGVDLLLFETFSDLDDLLLARRRGRAAARPADRRPDDVRRGPRRWRRHHARRPRPRRWPRPASTPSASTAASGPQVCLEALAQMGRAVGRRARALDRAQRRPAAARRGPVRLRRRARRTSRDAVPRLPGRRRADRRRLLRHDARAHRAACARRSTRPAAPAPTTASRAAAHDRCRRHAAHRRRRARAPAQPAEPPPPTRLGQAARRDGRFVISVEIDPPRSVRIERTIEAAPAAAGRRRRPRQHQRLGDGARAHGRDGRRVRHPARPRPRVPRPLHDARPQPDGARVGAARRPRARRAQHPGADRRPAARSATTRPAPASGTSTRSA